jgi:hypothetical protein
MGRVEDLAKDKHICILLLLDLKPRSLGQICTGPA